MNNHHITERIPLQDGTKLNDNITIIRLISSRGGSSLVYLAKEGPYSVIVKEFFPSLKNSGNEYLLKRDENGCCVSFARGSDTVPYYREAVKKFKNQADKTIKAIMPENDNDTKDYRSLYCFTCRDITETVKNQVPFNGTVSYYLVFSTTNGLTLEDYAHNLNDGEDLSLKQVLYITRSILYTVKHLHNKRGYLHLDIKPDNIYISTDIETIEGTVCFLLDLEGMQKIGHISEIPGISVNFAAPEISQIYEFNKEEKTMLINNIGIHSDTYSIAACMFKLIMGKKYTRKIWEHGIKRLQSQKELVFYIKREVSKVVSVSYPYLVDKITNMLSKGLYCLEGNNPAFAAELSKCRYASCADFIADINTLLDILDNRGFHPEILAMHSREHFSEDYYFRKSRSHRNSEDLILDDGLFIQEWLPDVTD